MVTSTPQSLYRNGLKLINKGRYEEAAAVFTAALEQEPDNSSYLMSRGECHVAMNNYQEAIRDYESTLRLSESSFQAHWGLARCKEAIDDIDGAIASYNNALELNPEFSEGFFNRGKLLHFLGQKESALADFRRAYEKAILNRPDPAEFFRDMPEYVQHFSGDALQTETFATRSLMELLATIKADPESEFAGGASEEAIRELEKSLGVTFPAGYVNFLRNFDGGEFRLVRMFSVAAERGYGRIEDQVLFLRNNLPAFADGYLIPIGDDFGGNVYCFDTAEEQDGEYRILQWDHENDDDAEPDLVADSFCEFLEFELLGTDRYSGSAPTDRDDSPHSF